MAVCFNIRRVWLGAGLCIWLGSVSVPAATNSAWFARVWQAEDGLPDNSVTGVVQTPDGYLWVATQHALTRFDGARFRNVPLPEVPGMAPPSIRALLRGPNQELWLALEQGVAMCLAPGRTNVFTSESGLPRFRPVTMAQDAQGAVWIAYADGSACRIERGTVRRFTARDGLAGVGQCWVVSDAQGQIWFAKAGRVGVFRDGQFVALAVFPDRVVRLGAARDGGVWVCAGVQVWRFAEGEQTNAVVTLQPARVGTIPRVLHEDRSGALWVGTSASGLFRVVGGEAVPVATSHSEVTDLTEDREGNLWAGTGGGGLNRLRPRVVMFESERTGLPFETMRSLCEDTAGAVWAVSHNGMVWRWQNETWQAVPSRGAWPEGQATCVAADPAGGVWLGMYHFGLRRWQDGRVTSWRRSDGLGSDTIRSLLVSSNGDLWIGLEASNCVQRLRDGQLTFFALPPEARPVRAMAEDAAGDIWMGTSGGELLRATKDELVDETARTRPVPQPIRCLHWTPDGSLWIGYAGAGLGRLKDGKFAVLGADQGLPEEFISFIESDGSGGLCFAGDRGVFAVRQRELDAVAEGQAERVRAVKFGRDEALPSLQANYGYFPASLQSRNGRLWFPMRTGLVRVRADRMRGSHVPPPVLIERVLLDGRPLPLPNSAGVPARLVLPPRHRKVDFEFTALSFIAPDNVHFRHWLEGWDTDWVDGDTVRHASYSRLPAGDYRFRVTACNNAGVWSETGAVMAFTVLPFFWQTWWFRLAVGAGFTAAVIGLVRYLSFRSLRRKLLRVEQEAALQQERARIAKDIHDDLGASLTQIALLGELARHDLAAPDTMRGHIDRISATARRGVKSLEEIVWAVNPRNDTLAHLLDYAGQYAVDFLRVAEIRCRIDFPDHPPARNLPADVRHNLFLVIKEALNNIAKHAQAGEVWLRAEAGEVALRLTIEDNGRGFSSPPEHAGADGLRNMRQRLAEIGGRCDIESHPGRGTKITLTVPWRPPHGS